MAECILLKSGGGTGSDDCTATKANVLSGCTAVTKDSDDEAAAGTMANKGAWTSRIGVNGKAIIPAGYHNGSGYVDQAITNREAVNASLAINGTYTIPEGYHNGTGKVVQNIATMGAQTIIPGNGQKVVSCSGKYMTGNVTVPAVINLIAANIKKGVNVGGVVGTWEGYVAAATDLYYNGINNAGFTSTSDIMAPAFDSNQITLNGAGAGSFNIKTSIAYNLTGYSRIVVEGYFANTKGATAYSCILYTGDVKDTVNAELLRFTRSASAETSYTFNFNYQATKYLRIVIMVYGASYIRRISLA